MDSIGHGRIREAKQQLRLELTQLTIETPKGATKTEWHAAGTNHLRDAFSA